MVTEEDLSILLQMKSLYELAPNLTQAEWREGSYLWKWDLIWNEFWNLKETA